MGRVWPWHTSGLGEGRRGIAGEFWREGRRSSVLCVSTPFRCFSLSACVPTPAPTLACTNTRDTHTRLHTPRMPAPSRRSPSPPPLGAAAAALAAVVGGDAPLDTGDVVLREG